MFTVDCLEPELIRVCLEEDGVKSCCFVSSHHLAPEKERQLREANDRQRQS
jgi:hypothetical protein